MLVEMNLAYIEVNGHEISMDEETLQAAVLYAVKEELDFV